MTLGGRRIPVQRPRVRAADGSGELPVAAYQLFSGTELLGRMALERMLHGAVDPPLPARAGAGRQWGGAGRLRHQQVGGLPPVCRHDRDGVGRAASLALGLVGEQRVPKLVQRPAGASRSRTWSPAPPHFQDRDGHELRGVPGSWRLFLITSYRTVSASGCLVAAGAQ